MQDLYQLSLRMGDNCLVLGQQVSAWCGHAPILEEDIALANVALDLIGQASLWLQLAGELEGEDRTADDLAFLRDERKFRNCLLVEQPNGDFAQTLMRQFLFDAWHHPKLLALSHASDERVASVAKKSEKEAAYHLARSTELVVGLGDGSQESHARMQSALDNLWRFTGELAMPDEFEVVTPLSGDTNGPPSVTNAYAQTAARVFAEATLTIPADQKMQFGGKSDVHTEHLGHILSEMQYLQRTYLGVKW